MSFTRHRLASLLACMLLLGMATVETAGAASAPKPRGGRVGWARLITPSGQWDIHSDRDPDLAEFIRKQTSLNIDPTWNAVDAGDLEKLCAYPFIYAKDLSRVMSQHDLGNIGEYLRRGGFILIDPCSATASFSADSFLRQHGELFSRLLPGSTVRELPDSHEIFRCYFTVTVDDLFSPDMIRAGASKPPKIGMLGVFQGDRLIAVISVSGLECGWPQTPGRTPGCMKAIVNTYVYAMTR